MDNKDISQKLLDASNHISNQSRKGGADWVIVSGEGLGYLNRVIEEQIHRNRLKQRILKINHLKSKI